MALVLSPGTRLVFPPARVAINPAGLVTFGATSGDPAGGQLRLVVRFRAEESSETGAPGAELYSELLPQLDSRNPWVERHFRPALPQGATGSFIVECASVSGAPSAGELALYEFVVSDEPSLDLDRARAFRGLRMRNEKSNFDAYYQHSLFQEAEDAPAPCPRTTFATRLKRSWSALAGQRPAAPPEATRVPTPAAAPAPASAFTYSHNLLLARLALAPPAFGLRLAARAAAPSRDGPLRILSLCSGEARIEAGLVRHLPAGSVSLTLLDMNPDLLNRATQRMAQSCAAEGILAAADHWRLTLRQR